MKLRMAWVVAMACVLTLSLGGVALAQGNVNIAGKWESKFTRPNGESMTSTFTFTQDGDKVKGSVAGGMGGEAPIEGMVKGKEVKFTVTRKNQAGEEIKTEYTVTVDGDTMKGTVKSPRGDREWSATKVK